MNFFKRLLLVLDSVSDAVTVLYIVKSKKEAKLPEKQVVQTAKMVRKITKIAFCITVPVRIILTKLGIVKEMSEAQKALIQAFIQFSLIESASYVEWRDCNQIIARIDQDKIKEVLSENELSSDKQQDFLKIIVNVLGGAGIFSMRFETKDEYLLHRCGEESKEEGNPVVEYFADEFDELEKLDSYEKIYKGLRIVFLRKPQGSKTPNTTINPLVNLIPGMH